MRFVYAAAIAAVTALPTVTLAAPPAPISIEGKCAKKLGGQYDPVRAGWYVDPATKGDAWRACVAKARKSAG